MTLQEITTKFAKKSWLRLCTLNNINKWNLIDFVDAPVYASRHFIRSGLEIGTRTCYKCGTKLSLGIWRGNFLARLMCKCSKDGTNLMKASKLECMFTASQTQLAMMLANQEKSKGFPNTINFWTNQGFSETQALEKVLMVQRERSSRSPASKKGSRGFSARSHEYWIRQGHTPEEAANKVREIQTTNGIEFYKRKYGAAGEDLFNQRIERWLNSDGNKRMVANRSKRSLELFENLGVGYYGPNEKTVRGKKKVHRVDFLYGKKIIEYYGDYWHGNPKFYAGSHQVRKKTVADIWDHDAKKVKDLQDNGYQVLVIWEHEYTLDPENTVKQCKDFIK